MRERLLCSEPNVLHIKHPNSVRRNISTLYGSCHADETSLYKFIHVIHALLLTTSFICLSHEIDLLLLPPRTPKFSFTT